MSTAPRSSFSDSSDEFTARFEAATEETLAYMNGETVALVKEVLGYFTDIEANGPERTRKNIKGLIDAYPGGAMGLAGATMTVLKAVAAKRKAAKKAVKADPTAERWVPKVVPTDGPDMYVVPDITGLRLLHSDHDLIVKGLTALVGDGIATLELHPGGTEGERIAKSFLLDLQGALSKPDLEDTMSILAVMAVSASIPSRTEAHRILSLLTSRFGA